MNAQELAQRIQSGQAPVVVDVRTGFEFKAGHIPGALHAPTWKIVLGLAGLPRDKGAHLVLHCELGPRAVIAKKLLGALGFRNIELLEGHMSGWRKAGLPVQKN